MKSIQIPKSIQVKSILAKSIHIRKERGFVLPVYAFGWRGDCMDRRRTRETKRRRDFHVIEQERDIIDDGETDQTSSPSEISTGTVGKR